MRNRREDARLDMQIHDMILRDSGVVEPDQPTAWSHLIWMERYDKAARGDFTAEERERIRAHIGLGPFAANPAAEEDVG